MAEIILEPTALSKVIPLSVKLNEVDTSLNGQLITNKQFNTADTDAWFSFTLDGLAATTGTFDLALINLHDKSVFNHTDKVFNTNPFYYKLDSGTDELTNEIRHAGKWVGQLVVTLPNGDSATRKFIFAIEGHILDGAVVQTILLDDYNALITDIEASKNELAQYNIDYASLIGTVTSQEEARVQAEELRVIADALRETKEGTRQTTFEANEVIRDGVVAAAIETEMIAQNVATKLTEKEATFAPRILSVEQQLADKADRAEVANGLTAKGASLYASLPTTGNSIGDYYYCSDGNGTDPAGNYVWNGAAWYFGGTGDNGYNQVTETLANVINHIKSKNLIDNTKLTSGAILNNGATYVGGSYANYSYTDYIPVDVGSQLIFSSNQTKALCSVRWIACFDSEKNILSASGSSMNTQYFTIPSGVSLVILTFNTATYGVEIQAEVSDVVAYTGYVPYGTDISIKDDVMPDWVASKAEIPVIEPLVKAYLPPEICCAVGRTIELYNNQVCLNAKKYHLRWKCNIGAAMERKFSITAKESHLNSRSSSAIPMGWYYLDLYIYDDEKTQLWYGRTMLKIVSDSKPVKKILPIGDSLTNWKRWLPEVKKLSADGINFVGTRVSGVDYSADGTEYLQGTINHEGRSGFSAINYLTNTEYTFETRFDGVGDGKANPFWDGSKFSLSHYISVQTGVAVPDAVQIYLGANGNDDQVINAQNIAQMVTLIRAEYPTMPIFVINTIYRSTQDGYASIGTDGYASITGANAWRYNEDDKIQKLMITLNTLLQNASDVHIISLAVTHDTQYNFGNQQTKVNPRSEQVEYLPVESVHPQAQGYFQMADMFYSAYCCYLV